MKRPLSKAVLVGILFATAMLGMIIYLTLGLKQLECEVCVELDGKTNCKIVRGENQQDAMSTAKENACSEISNGRTETIRCSQNPITSSKCKQL